MEFHRWFRGWGCSALGRMGSGRELRQEKGKSLEWMMGTLDSITSEVFSNPNNLRI